MSSFQFNKLPVELQKLVWHHARASVGQVIIGELNYSTKTLTIRSNNIDRLTEYIRLLFICHISRQEALRDRPVFLVDNGDFLFADGLDWSNLSGPWDSAHRCLAIK